jgi:hypothetical protein
MRDPSALVHMTRFFHNLGEVMWFESDPNLREHGTLPPPPGGGVTAAFSVMPDSRAQWSSTHSTWQW